MKYYLAIDIGASSGRHILGHLENDRFVLEEVYRFANGACNNGEAITWDIDNLVNEVIIGLKKCKEINKIPVSVAIDTWAVDYVLLDSVDKPIYPVYSYRDERGQTAAKAVHNKLPFEIMHKKAGVQFQNFNTVYQLYSDHASGRLSRASDFLMLPEYLSFILTGKKFCEYTNATSTGLLNAETKEWSESIISNIGLAAHIFNRQPKVPPYSCGEFSAEIKNRIGFIAEVVMVTSHDTASAVVAVPSLSPCFYISSGTWSLVGTELSSPNLSVMGRQANFTNEGGLNTIRFQKNVMGLWLIQCLKKELKDTFSFADLMEKATVRPNFDYKLEINREEYFMPESVIETIKNECIAKGYPIPSRVGEYAYAILNSLAHSYSDALKQITAITGFDDDKIYIIGGGSNNKLLNRLTELRTGKRVICGSSEATALGNIALQALYAGAVIDVNDMKEKIINIGK